MKTHCPECDTVLSVTPEQLKARGGKVRCGVCHTVFNALDYAVSQQSSSRYAVRHEHKHEYEHELYHDNAYDDRVYRDEPYIRDSLDDDRVLHDDVDEDYYVRSNSRRRIGGVFWVLAVFILLLALVLQGAVVFRNQIAHYFPSSRAVLIQLCSVARCELGGTRSIEQFVLKNVSLNIRRDVPADSTKTALVLQATLVNKENIPAEWPSLVLSLKNERGQLDRQRIIEPEEYVVSELRMRPMVALSEYDIRLHLNLLGTMATAYELKPYYEE